MKNKFVIVKVLIFILVVLLLFVFMKVYHFVVISHVFNAIMKFRDEDNRAYLVSNKINCTVILEQEILLKDKIMKYVNWQNNLPLEWEWKDSNSGEGYCFNTSNKEIYVDSLIIENSNTLVALPNFIVHILKVNKIKISEILDIYYITLTKYKEKICYKIVTKDEVTIVEKDTYLPLYSSVKRMKSDEESKGIIERSYEFKVGEVRDEDVELPDLSEYRFVE